MSRGYKGRNFDPNYTKRGRGQNRGSFQGSPQQRFHASDVSGLNQGMGNANQRPANSGVAQHVSDSPVGGASAQSRKGGRRPRRKSNPSNKKNKLAKPTKLALDVKTVDYKRARTNYFSPSFGPLQEVYHYLRPRMIQYFNDYCRSQSMTMIAYNFKFFYQSFAFRVSELYLSKVWVYSSPQRFVSGHYDQIKGILNSIQPLIKEMVRDVSQFVGNFELHGRLWTNKFPLLTISHHWLQAAYGYASRGPYKHNNQRKGLTAKRMSHLPLVITDVRKTWPIPQRLLNQMNAEDVNEGWNLLTSNSRGEDVAKSLHLQNWYYPAAEDDEADALVDLEDITVYTFNGMIDPTPDIWDWIEIDTGVDPTTFEYHIGEDNPDEVHPTLKQVPSNELQRPCLTRFFPWRNTHRTKSAFIIQFNCEFLKDTYNEKLAREGVEDMSMPLASVLLQLIGCEIDCFMDYWDAEFILGDDSPIPGMTFRKTFAVRDPETWTLELVNQICSGVIKITYENENKERVVEKLPMRLRYKLPLWWHAYDEFEDLNDMNGFLNPETGFEEKGDDEEAEPEQRDAFKYDVERHWWKWVMAGVYPRWCHYRVICQDLECHWSSACASVQLDFLKNEVPVENYKTPDSTGSSAQISRIFKIGQSENLVHTAELNAGELINAFIITDRANWIHPSRVGTWSKDYVYVSHFQGLDQVRRIKDIINSFFPQSAWTIKNQ